MIATIALFVALGGGYAVAFKGSGTLQKGAIQDIPDEFTPVRTLTDMGRLDALCDGGGDVALFFVNTSGEPILGTGQALDGDPVESSAGAGLGFVFDGGNEQNNINLHLAPADGSKRPQADVQITVHETGDCSTSQVSILVLNTEQ